MSYHTMIHRVLLRAMVESDNDAKTYPTDIWQKTSDLEKQDRIVVRGGGCGTKYNLPFYIQCCTWLGPKIDR